MANEVIGARQAAGVLRAARPLLFEVSMLLVLFAAYKWGRTLVEGGVGEAMANASRLWDLERALHLPGEETVQGWVLGWDHGAFAANVYYVGVHFPGTALLLIWLYARHRPAYRRVRTELVVLTAAGLAVQMLFPLAPPRLAGLGMVDTMVTVGPSAYPAAADGIANQYAAMPSLHIGWALLVAVAVLRTSRSPWRWVVALHAPVTVLVVVVTANHYWLDGLVAAGLLGVAVAGTAVVARRRREVPDEQFVHVERWVDRRPVDEAAPRERVLTPVVAGADGQARRGGGVDGVQPLLVLQDVRPHLRDQADPAPLVAAQVLAASLARVAAGQGLPSGG